jgi:hypothetical protein
MDAIPTREIKWHPKTEKISQIPKEGLEYALVSPDYQQIHQLVWCKDFMQDAIHGFLHKTKTQIYNFVYDPAVDAPVSLDRTRIMITNWKDAEFGDRVFTRLLPTLHEVEGRLGMDKTVVEKCRRVPPRYARSGVWLLDASPRWSSAPPMVSLYTLLVRIGLVAAPGDSLQATMDKIKDGTTDSYYSEQRQQDRPHVRRAEPGITRILNEGDTAIFGADMTANYPSLRRDDKNRQYVTIHTIHEHFGIVGFSENLTKRTCPHWHAKAEAEVL